MAEQVPVAVAPLPMAVAPQDMLAQLRSAGAERIDPVAWRHLEALARRMASAPPAVQAALQGRWQAACAALEQRCAQPAVPAARMAGGAGAAAALAELNRYIRGLAQSAHAGTAPGSAGEDSTELRSLRGFRETWSRIAAVDAVDAALVRGPENAGPLNSLSLVLRSLALMRSLSPDYLRRFLSQVESLRALEEAALKVREPATAAPRARKTRKKT